MQKSHGFSMIEILVTVLLISIGVLGMAAMQSRTINTNQDSAQRNTAATLANDLLEMIQATPAGLPTNSAFFKQAGTAFPVFPSSGCGVTSTGASQQLACWADRASKLLPGAENLLTSDFYVCNTTAPGVCGGSGTAIEIQVAWSTKSGDCMDGTTNTVCTYRLRSEVITR